MPPSNFYFGGGASDSVMHPIVILLMLTSIILIFILKRNHTVVPFLVCAFLVPVGQMLILGGVHLFVLRILLIFACVKMFLASQSASGSIFKRGINTFDYVFFSWAIFRASAFIILFKFQSGAVVNQAAFLIDIIAGYLFLRWTIQGVEDIRITVMTLAVITAFIGLCMVNEKLRSQNIFGYLGGFRISPEIRDGAIRAQGPFSHPILAGCFGATLMPVFLWLWKMTKEKSFAVAGMIGSTCMVACTASSTPLMAYVGGIIAVCFWPMRKSMRLFRWGIVLVLVGLHLVMKAPVWFLIARIDLTGSSSGYHRAMLVDTFIRHFNEWWFVGTNDNANWGYDMWDLSNQFVAEGISGGLATFVCFVTMITICFSRLGRAMKVARNDRSRQWLLWFLGAALVSHLVAFWGISYFDHTQISWFTLLVMISVATMAPVRKIAGSQEIVPAVTAIPHLAGATLKSV